MTAAAEIIPTRLTNPAGSFRSAVFSEFKLFTGLGMTYFNLDRMLGVMSYLAQMSFET
jgi:hypothetical protein